MNQGKKIHYGWVVIAMGALATVAAHGFGRMSYTIILPAMKDGLKFDYTQLGLLGTGNFIGYLCMALIGGFLAARFGTRIVITLALFFLGLTIMLTGLAQSFGFALSMRFLTGLANGAVNVPAMALASAWFAVKRRGFAAGIVAGGPGIGTLISGLIVPPLLSSYGSEGWRYAWYVLGGVALVIAAVVSVFVRSGPHERGLLPLGVSEDPRPLAVPAVQNTSIPKWSQVYREGSVWYLGLVYFFFGCSYIIYMTFFAVYLVKEIGMTQAFAGGLWAMVGALCIFSGIIWGLISDRLGRSRGAALGYLVLAVAYIIYAVVRIEPGFYLSAILFGLTMSSLPTIMAAAAGDFVGGRMAPAVLGFVTLFFGIGQALGPTIGGYLADLTGSFTVPFLLAGGLSLAGMAASLFLRKPPHEARSPQIVAATDG
ncbi:MAG: MFS transporter [Desulfobacteraceae bacterium]|nr:MAG: MFS transporter [Desulfobacteraceae bacterium]